MPLSIARPGLALGCAAVCGSATGGAGGLIFGYLALGSAVNRRLPAHSPVLGGLALLLIVAVPMAATAVAAWLGRPVTDSAAMAAGGLLMGWAAVQPFIIGSFSFLQPTMFAAGLAVALAGYRHRRALIRPDSARTASG